MVDVVCTEEEVDKGQWGNCGVFAFRGEKSRI